MPEIGLGVQSVLRNDVSGKYPFSFAETPSGLLLLANGMDPMLRWDGLAQSADFAGIVPPTVAMELGGTGLGYITGDLAAYQRFVDDTGNVSDLSPVSNTMTAGVDGLIDDINYSKTTGVVTIKSLDHPLVTGDVVLIDNVTGIGTIHGAYTITVVDGDNFTLNNFVNVQGIYLQGGSWTSGSLNIIYGGVPIPTQPRVVRRQILRNLSGTFDVLYVDIDTTDLTSTSFTSQTTDESLAAQVAVPLTWGDNDLPFANRNGTPPPHKTVVASHKGRIFAACDAVYNDGHAEVSFNSVTVQGVGTDWRTTFIGRLFYATNAANAYPIIAVNEALQTLTLASPFLEVPQPFYAYTISPVPAERRLVYYSEAGYPESWPAYNAFALPEDNDQIVGLTSLGQYLYVIEHRHVYRVTFQSSPDDGYTFLASQRGSLNNRTYVVLENKMYFLDESGIHKFDGQDSEPISMPIQNLFQYDGTSDVQIDWAADQTLWHAAHDPVRDTIRWFVNMVGYDEIIQAICYNYRTDRWWIEQYPTPVVSSASATIGSRRSLVGTSGRRCLCLSVGNYDGVDGTGTTRGNPTAFTSTTITDANASFEALEGAPVSIVDGTGVGQTRIIASVAGGTTLEVVQPWVTTPDITSVYQVGGVPWLWRSGWFRYVDDEADNPRDVDIVFDPTDTPNLLDVQLYFDKNETPRSWERTIDQDFVRTQKGSPRITLDMENGIGWARQRVTGHSNKYSFGDRFVSVELSGTQAGDFVRVSQIIIEGVE